MSPSELLGDLLGLAVVVALLGAKHGFDADHLAAIDAMTRCHFAARPRLARRTGTLFSLGHGVVVAAMALAVAALTQAWQVPAWLEAFGAGVSITVLCVLGIINLVAVLRTPAGSVVRMTGLGGGWVARCAATSGPFGVMAVGALFALSFDAAGLAALIAVSAAPFGGAPAVLALASLFVAGMLVTDGINSVWLARLLRRCDATAALASRVMASTVALISLATAALGIASLMLPTVGEWSATHRTWIGAAIVATVLASFLIGVALSRRLRRRDERVGAMSLGPARS